MCAKIFVAMSGGVDSSVSALLLKEQGHEVVGLFMKNWEETLSDGSCTAAQDQEDAFKVCRQLDIPCYTVNFTKEYWDNVFVAFLEDLKQGLTPNPDILCNREIKFKVLFEKALSLGADFLATGHYCRTESSPNGTKLLKGLDPFKDQSYFLHAVSSNVLDKVLFPVGALPKQQVRDLARKHNILTAEKKDSTGICFIGERNIKKFLQNYIAYQPGLIESVEGKILGEHEGVAFYTIGQRKGLKIGGAGLPWFVVGKDINRNVVLVAQGDDHPALYADSLTATEIHWISTPPTLPFKCTTKIRYRQADQECIIEKIEDGRTLVRFTIPQRAITPRQSIVFYSGDECLGGGFIQSSAQKNPKID